MPPTPRRCSSVEYSRYSPSSSLAGWAPRRSRCHAGLSPRAARRPTHDEQATGSAHAAAAAAGFPAAPLARGVASPRAAAVVRPLRRLRLRAGGRRRSDRRQPDVPGRSGQCAAGLHAQLLRGRRRAERSRDLLPAARRAVLHAGCPGRRRRPGGLSRDERRAAHGGRPAALRPGTEARCRSGPGIRGRAAVRRPSVDGSGRLPGRAPPGTLRMHRSPT